MSPACVRLARFWFIFIHDNFNNIPIPILNSSNHCVDLRSDPLEIPYLLISLGVALVLTTSSAGTLIDKTGEELTLLDGIGVGQ
jgi:hypothetical protein